MSYEALTTEEIAVGQPISNALMTKIKNNFDALNSVVLSNAIVNVPNGSFESDEDADGVPDSWEFNSISGGTGAQESVYVGHGAKSFKFTSTGAASGGSLLSDWIEISDKLEYFFNWLILVGGAAMKVRVDYYQSDKITLISSQTLYDNTPADLTGAWQQFLFQLTPAADARFIKIYFEATGTLGQTLYIDGCALLLTGLRKWLQDFTTPEGYTNAGTWQYPLAQNIHLPFATNMPLRLSFVAQGYRNFGAYNTYMKFVIAGVDSNVVEVVATSYADYEFSVLIPADNAILKKDRYVTLSMGIYSTNAAITIHGKRDSADFEVDAPSLI